MIIDHFNNEMINTFKIKFYYCHYCNKVTSLINVLVTYMYT